MSRIFIRSEKSVDQPSIQLGYRWSACFGYYNENALELCAKKASRAYGHLTHFAQSFKMGTVTKGFDARLANRPFLVFDYRALWRSTLSARVPKNQKLKMVS